MNMINWRHYARTAVERSYSESHPELEVNLKLQDTRNRLCDTRDLLATLIKEPSVRRTLIVGRPGSGKSYILNWLHNSLAVDLEHEIDVVEEPLKDSDGEVIASKTFEPTEQTIVPVLIRLNAFDVSAELGDDTSVAFFSHINQQLSRSGVEVDIREFLSRSCRFVFLVDELDEMAISSTSINLRELRRFVEFVLEYSNVQVVMAGRKIAANRFMANFRTFRVRNLMDEELAMLLNGLAGSEQTLLSYVNRWEGLKEFVATPYFATEIANYWNETGDDDFNLGRLLCRLMESLVERQRKTEYADQIAAKMRRRLAIIERLAFESLDTQGQLSSSMLQKESNLDDDDELEEWLLLMEFTSSHSSTSQWKSKWIQAYFAAQYLSSFETAPNKAARTELIRQRQPTGTLYATLLLLQDMLQEDYTFDITELSELLAQRISENERELISQAFERAICEFVKDFGFPDVRNPYKPKYIQPGEIDVYATRERSNVRETWIIECKFRSPPYPQALKQEYFDQLLRYVTQVSERESRIASEEGKTLSLVAVLATNGGDRGQHAQDLAQANGIEIWDFDLPLQRFTGRQKLSSSQRTRILANSKSPRSH
jgi:hypothetical protein